MQFLRPLARRELRHLLLASLISSAGTGMSLLAGKLYIWESTRSNTLVGYLGALGFAVGILSMGRLGVLIDRYPRRRVLVAADLYRLVLVGSIPLALATDLFGSGLLFAVIFLLGFGHTVGYPALTALLGEVTPLEERPWVNGMLEICMQVGMMGGAALSGVLYSLGGVGLIYLLDGLTFLISAILFGTMPAWSGSQPPVVEEGEFLGSFAEGWDYLLGRPLLMLYGFAALLPWVATMSFNTVLPGLVLAQLGGSSIEVGILDAGYSVGGVAAGILGAVALRSLGARWSMKLSLALGLLGIATLLLVSKLTSALLAALAFGLGNSSFRVVHRTFVLQRVPNHVLGRVLSLFAWAGLSGSAIGMVVAGRCMDWWGEVSGVGVLAVAQLLSLSILLVLGWRGFFAPPGARTPHPDQAGGASLDEGLPGEDPRPA